MHKVSIYSLIEIELATVISNSWTNCAEFDERFSERSYSCFCELVLHKNTFVRALEHGFEYAISATHSCSFDALLL